MSAFLHRSWRNTALFFGTVMGLGGIGGIYYTIGLKKSLAETKNKLFTCEKNHLGALRASVTKGRCKYIGSEFRLEKIKVDHVPAAALLFHEYLEKSPSLPYDDGLLSDENFTNYEPFRFRFHLFL